MEVRSVGGDTVGRCVRVQGVGRARDGGGRTGVGRRRPGDVVRRARGEQAQHSTQYTDYRERYNRAIQSKPGWGSVYQGVTQL